jgi:hypothetical protein
MLRSSGGGHSGEGSPGEARGETVMAVRTRAYGAASVVMTITLIIVTFLVLGILLVLVNANEHNTLVNFVLDVGGFFAKPFNHLIPQDNRKQDYLVNWGIAAIVYFAVGVIIARIIRRT